MKKVLLTISALLISSLMFAKENKVTLRITNVQPSKGNLILSYHTSKESFDKQLSVEKYTIDSDTELEIPLL